MMNMLVILAALVAVASADKHRLRRNLASTQKVVTQKKKTKKAPKPTLERGCFDWGYYIRE